MSRQQIATRTVTTVPTVDIPAKRAISFTYGLPTAGGAILGIADHNLEANVAGRVIVGESAICETGAAVDAATETRVMVDAQARMITWTAGNTIAGRLVPGQSATAAGQFVEVYLYSR